MKIWLFAIILGFSPLCFANSHLPIPKNTFNFNASADEDVLTKEMVEFRHACIKKAELGEQLALKKINGTPLNIVLSSILDSHQIHSHMPWYLVLEIQRLARDAYRNQYDNNDDIDQFVMDLYHSCLNHGW